VTRETPTNEVRDAYFRLAKVVHPDMPQFHGGPQLKIDATRAFQAITAANAVLGDPAKRKLYLQQQQAEKLSAAIESVQNADDALLSAEGGVALEAPANPEVARIYMHRGRQQMLRRDWVGAQEALDLAGRVLKDKELSEAKLLLGWAVFNNVANPERDRIERAKALWLEVTGAKQAQNTHVAQANYYLAVWHKLYGDMKQVQTHLSACLALDPKHIEAAREKRLLERRKTTGTFADADDKTTKDVRGARGPSKVAPVAQAGGKVKIERKPTFLERIFGKR